MRVMYPRVEWRGLSAFARCNKACVFRKIIYVTLSWNLQFLQNIPELGLRPEIFTQIDWHLKIQNTTFLCIKFPPPILSPLHSTRGYIYLPPWVRYIYISNTGSKSLISRRRNMVHHVISDWCESCFMLCLRVLRNLWELCLRRMRDSWELCIYIHIYHHELCICSYLPTETSLA